MTISTYEIPLKVGTPQTFPVTLSQVEYQFTLKFCDWDQGGWVLDIANAAGDLLVTGIPLTTGLDLLAPYPDLNFGGQLWVQTTSDPDAVPTFTNLGSDGLLYWVVTS